MTNINKLNNEKFRKANKARKRVMIARDVLAQLNAGMFIAKPMVWAQLKGKETIGAKKNDQQVCSLLDKKKCEVCGIGALFVSAVTFANKLKVSDLEVVKDAEETANTAFISEDDSFNYLAQFFDYHQLRSIETAFELGEGASYYSEEAAEFCRTYNGNGEVDKYDDDDDGDAIGPYDRMRLIMENIIANKGTFCPEFKPVATYHTPGFKG